MRLFFTGSHGTGKSTIVNKIGLKGLNVYDSFSKKFLSNKDQQKGDHKDFYSFQLRIFSHCANIYINEDNFISSRSFIDTLAYTNLSRTSKLDISILKMTQNIQNMCNEYINLLKNESDIFYFYTPIEFDLTDDNNELRLNDNINFQQQVDADIRHYLNINRIPYTTLSGTVEERMEKVKEVIKYEEWLKTLDNSN